MPGAIFTTVAWEIAQIAFGIYSTHVDYTKVYGALAALAILLLWFYYMGSIFLFGAELSAQWPRTRAGRTAGSGSRSRPADRVKQLLRSFLAFAGLTALLGAITPLSAPIVVVYPLTITGGLKSDAGANMATLFATKLAQAGDIIVKPYTPGTERPQFLEGAKQLGAGLLRHGLPHAAR